MLEKVAREVWIAHRKLRFLGVETGTRMTVIRLAGGRLFVHSPVELDEVLRAEVEALGEVSIVVAPSLFHHLSVNQWLRAYPRAEAYCCPGLERKRRDVAWHGLLGDDPEPAWSTDLEQVHFSSRTLENEVVFFHGATRTFLCADAIFNLSQHRSRVTRWVARAIGNTEPGATRLERLMIRNRTLARSQVGRMVAWDPERILLAHGDPVLHGGRRVLEHAYEWL